VDDTEMTRNLDVRKVPASTVAGAIIAGITRGKEQIPIARVRLLIPMARLAPGIADGIVQRALQPSRGPSARS
jgi:hypothetical protein